MQFDELILHLSAHTRIIINMNLTDDFTTATSLMYDSYSGNDTDNITDYFYDYVFDPPLEELVPVSIAYGVTLLLGVIGNGLVIFSVSRYEGMRTITNTFLLSLAFADLLLVLFCVPVKVKYIVLQ